MTDAPEAEIEVGKIPFNDKTLRSIGALPFEQRPVGIDADGSIVTVPIGPKMKDYVVRDSLTPGFGLRITKNGKVFIVERKLAGKKTRFVCGSYPSTSLKTARVTGQAALRDFGVGIDPNHRIKDNLKETVDRWDKSKLTFGFVVTRDAERKATDDAPSTARDRKDVASWAGRTKIWTIPVHEVTVDDVKRMMDSVTQTVSGTTALKVWRYTRAAWGRMSSAEEPRVNPFDEYLKTYKLPETKRRSGFLPTDEEQGKLWLRTIAAMREGTTGRRPFTKQVMADYIILSLCWGARRSETAELVWDDVDFVRNTVVFRSTKNKTDHYFPLTDGCKQILLQRKIDNSIPRGRDVKRAAKGEVIPVPKWVFPSEKRGFHLTEPAGALDIAEAGADLRITMHDLRRTFAGDVALDILGGGTSGKRGDFGLVKLAMNHADQNADMTQTYIMLRPKLNMLRPIYEVHERRVLTACGILKADEAPAETEFDSMLALLRTKAAKDPGAMAKLKELMTGLDMTESE